MGIDRKTGKEIIAQSVQVYAMAWKTLGDVLAQSKQHAAAKKIKALAVVTDEDVHSADRLLRETFAYDSKRPNAVSPPGFTPLLGMALGIHGMNRMIDTLSVTEDGTLIGHFFEFCTSAEEFRAQISESQEKKGEFAIEFNLDRAQRIFHGIKPLPTYKPKLLKKYKKLKDNDSDHENAYLVKVKGAQVSTYGHDGYHHCGVEMSSKTDNDAWVYFSLSPCGDPDSALEHGIEWAEKHLNHKYTVESVFKDCYENWPSLYKTRVDVINHLLFVIGNGYEWFNGAIVSTSPEDYIQSRARDAARVERTKAILADLDEEEHEYRIKMLKDILMRDEVSEVGPKPDKGGPVAFYPVCEYSKICCIPNDVQDDWLKLAFEAACMLRDRSKAVPFVNFLGKTQNPTEDEIKRQQDNAKLGAKLVTEIKSRFHARLHDIWMKDNERELSAYSDALV